MTDQIVAYCILLVVFILLAFWLGKWIGAGNQRDQWQDHMDRCNRYIFAVEDLDRWCGHASPHARLIARHLRAHGDGLPCNAGTPAFDEACTISGLREQLKRLDAAAPQAVQAGGEGGNAG